MSIEKKVAKIKGHIQSLEKQLQEALGKKKNGAAEKFVDIQRKLDKLREELRELTK